MALIKFGGGITEMRGSIAGNVFSRNKSGAYTRSRTTPVNPNSQRQSTVRSNMSLISRLWNDSASAAQRLSWEVFAQNMPESNKLGESINLSGFNQYVKSNLAAVNAGLPRIYPGPVSFVKPGEDPNLVVTSSEGTQDLTVAFDDNRAWLDEDEAAMIIQMGLPVNPSIRFFDGPWRHAGQILGDSGVPPTTPATITAPWPIAETQQVWVRARIIRADGRLSDWFQHIHTVSA